MFSWLKSDGMTVDDQIGIVEKKIFDVFKLEPVSRRVKVRHCHCEIYTVTFKAKADKGNYPIVLIHGFGTGVAYWAPNIHGLNEQYDIHCLDMPGFGRSDRPTFSQDETLAELEMVSCLEDWRKEMNIDKMYMIAHSFGAFFSTSYALEHPHRIEHLVLIDPWGFPEKPVLTQKQIDPQLYMHIISRILSYFNPFFLIRCSGGYASLLLRTLRPDVKEKFTLEGKKSNNDVYEYLALCNSGYPSGERLYKTLTDSSAFALRPMSRRFNGMDPNIRTSFIYGSKTFIDPGPALEIQYDRSDRVDVQILRGAGHLVNVDVVEDFNRIILSFFSRNVDVQS